MQAYARTGSLRLSSFGFGPGAAWRAALEQVDPALDHGADRPQTSEANELADNHAKRAHSTGRAGTDIAMTVVQGPLVFAASEIRKVLHQRRRRLFIGTQPAKGSATGALSVRPAPAIGTHVEHPDQFALDAVREIASAGALRCICRYQHVHFLLHILGTSVCE